jgi:DNA-binding NarL/FixJ family response regulator
MIRVIIADDHELVRHGLAMLLNGAEEIDLVGQADDGAVAVELVRELRPDVVLMDLSMPGMDGAEATRLICAQYPETKVVMLSSFAERRAVLDAIDAGAVGYLLKDGGMDEIVRALEAAARGEAPLSPRAAQAILSARPARQLPSLSVREREVAELVAAGLRNRDIAERMGIAEKTVKTHLTRVYQRLGVATRAELSGALKDLPT